MISAKHPFHFLSPVFKKPNSKFSLSKYIYISDSLFDEREIFAINWEDMTEERVEKELESLQSNQELALNSMVKIQGKTFHIPMIDFSTSDFNGPEIYGRMSRYLPKSILLNMAIFSSGRSFHAYCTTLLSPGEWADFMGRLLLINPVDQPNIVDSRWVGHRIIGGYGSLRWSNNSAQYLGMPSRIKFP